TTTTIPVLRADSISENLRGPVLSDELSVSTTTTTVLGELSLTDDISSLVVGGEDSTPPTTLGPIQEALTQESSVLINNQVDVSTKVSVKNISEVQISNDEVFLSIGLTCTIGCDEEEIVSNNMVTLTNSSFLPQQVIEQITLQPEAVIKGELDGTISIEASGFEPKSFVEVYMFSEPTFVGVLQTDTNGNIVGSLPTPDLEPGIHTLQALGTSESGNAVVSNLKVELIDTDNVAFTNDEGNDYVAWDFDTDTNYVEDKDYLVQYYYIENQLGETQTLLANTGFNLNYFGIAGVASLFTGLFLFTRYRKKRLMYKDSMDSLYQNISDLKNKIEFLVKESVVVLINFNKVNPYLTKGLYSKNQNEIIENLNNEVLNLISSVQNIEEKSTKKETISRTELENILQLIASDKIEFKFNDEILEENQIKNVVVNTDTSSKKAKLKNSNRGFAKILTVVSILLIFSGLLISGYTFNEMYLTNSKQAVAQEKLAAIYSGEQTFEINKEVFASESNFLNLRELFNDTPIFDNFIDQVLPEENISSDDVEPQIFGFLEISSINVQQYVLAGTNEKTLELGPGHYLSTALPGTGGNVGIAGHRTTYGAPFGDLDAVNIGDTILLTVDSKTFHYQVDSIDVVAAVGGEYVLFDRGDDRLTLTTCHPKYSAKERLIVSGILTKIELGG
ncbi:MAG: sortase, partial [Nitrosopumilaceae archaeon]